MKKRWLQKLRAILRIKSQIKSIRDNIYSMVREESRSQYYEENIRKLIEKVIQLIDTFQGFLSPDGKLPELSDYEDLPPEEVNLSLSELLVLFRQILVQLQHASASVQQDAINILYSYFIELQGLYDLIFVRKYENLSKTSRPPVALEDHQRRYFRCFRLTKQSLVNLKEEGIPEDILSMLESLRSQELKTEEKFLDELETTLEKALCDQYKTTILKHAQALQEIESDPVLQEYKSIHYRDLMNVSSFHHLSVVLLKLLPLFGFTVVKEFLQRKPGYQRILDPEKFNTVEELQEALAKHPLTETAKLRIALHRHTMRLCDMIAAHVILRWGRPVFESLVLATWIQTVKDHIVPGYHKPRWQAEHLDIQHDTEQEVIDNEGATGKIRLSSAFFMQPRIKFRFERFLIFKNRTMTVGDIVRTTELGNWMRQNSPDEFLQFFNVAFGDMGGLGIRTMPEHEIIETQDTLWLYDALMNFVPGGMTSPGSIVMRETNYGLTKAEQLFWEIRYYDPRFKGSSGFINDINIMLNSFRVLKKGRVGKALERTESFKGKRRGF